LLKGKSPQPNELQQRRLVLLLAVLVALLTVGAVRWTSALRSERSLREASLERLRAESRRRPNNPRVFYFLGLRARQAGQKNEAMRSFERAVQLSPDNEEYWLHWAALAAAVRGPLAAEAILATYLRDHPRSARVHLERAKIYLAREDYPLTYSRAADAVKVDPSLTEGWRLMGQAALTLHKAADAESAFGRAVALSPRDWRPRIGLGKALLEQKRKDEAVACLREAVRLAPDAPEAHLYLGLALLERARTHEDFAAARQNLREAERRKDRLSEEDRYQTFLYLGQSYQQESDWRNALSWFEQAAALAPGSATVQYALIQVYRGLGDTANAALAARRHTEIDRYNGQIKDLLTQIRTHPNRADLRLRLARVYAAHGNIVDAAKTYEGLIARNLAVPVARRELKALNERYAAATAPRHP
jgi:cytochrome c-type biogenesis protein CcmH/NrfG